MQKIKVLILGATGMAGSMIEKVLSTDRSISLGVSIRTNSDSNYFLGKGYNIHHFDVKTDIPFFAKNYDYIINCIGAIPSVTTSPDDFIKINTVFPRELAKNCKNSKIIHLTTDCVFDNRQLEENNEMSADLSRDFYAHSKHLGEVVAENVLNLRCSIIGPERKTQNSFLERFIRDFTHKGWSNVYWNGITTYHLAQIIKGIITKDGFFSGCHHIIPNGGLTRFDMMNVLNEFNWGKVKKDIKSEESPLTLNRKLTTLNPIRNAMLWLDAGYSAPPNFTTMICELHKAFWKLGYAKERGLKET